MLSNKKILLYLMLFLINGGIAMGSMEFLFSNKKYATKIKTETYLMSEEEVRLLFNDITDRIIVQSTYRELYQKTLYLVVRIKNCGDKGAWGCLKCKVYSRDIKIHIPSPLPFQKWNYYLNSLDGAVFPKDNSIPLIELEWEELYIK